MSNHADGSDDFDDSTPIKWIDQLPSDASAMEIQRQTDHELAIQIALDERLELDISNNRVERFVRAIPDLIVWFRDNYRIFPWRRTRDPWAILVAEILLQRTHAATVAKLYPEFMDRYPRPALVHRASDNEIFDVVESLGFGNKRTETLTKLAAALVEDHDSIVPEDLSRLQELPRIGPYTARACLCFAFGKPMALIDSNVAVVIQRVFDYPSSERAHKDESLYAFLDALVPVNPQLARAFNLAILDLRAIVCTDQPSCSVCPLNRGCRYAADSKT